VDRQSSKGFWTRPGARRKRVLVLALVLGGLMFVSSLGYSTTVRGITVLSTREVDFDAKHEPAGDRVWRKHLTFKVELLPFGIEPDLNLMIDEILDDEGADHLRNVEITTTVFALIVLRFRSVSIAADPWRPASEARFWD